MFWAGNGALYMRDMTTGEVLQIASGAEFQFASSNGERVFFTDTQRLTADAGANIGQPDLYECEIVEAGGKPSCVLTDLTPPNGAEPAVVRGIVVGGSEDGSYVYFVAAGVLGDGAQRGAGPGDFNLYVWHQGVTRLIAALSVADSPDWGSNLTYGATARVSPNGEWLAFMSQQSLTGYDNRDGVSGAPDEEVYLYNAVSEHLVCASCDPTGARPDGREYANTTGQGLENTLVAGFHEGWESYTWLAANIPSWTPQTYHNAVYQSRYLSNEGRLFFNTLDGLVPKDTNNQEDVYEYEPQGVGPESAPCGPDAASGSEVFKPQSEFDAEGRKGTEGAGCVALISSGTSGQESAFMEASENGSDVFFLTAAHLVSGEVEGGESLYDAHECSGLSPCVQEPQASPGCETAESCRAAPEPQPSIYGAPSSATFNGKGNLSGGGPNPPAPPPVKKVAKKTVKCKKGFVKGKGSKCGFKSKRAKRANRRGK